MLDEHGNLKISDFGLSSLYVGDADGEGASRTELLHTTCGTPNYVAPEVLSDQGYDGKKADVWSCGVILYVLLAGFLPFDESTIVALFAKIQNADFTYPSWFTPEVRSLLDQMLVADPKARFSISQIKGHPWYQGNATSGLVANSVNLSGTTNNAPTEAQLEAAVQQVSASKSSEDDHDIDHDDHDHLHIGTSPVSLNAFDLVSQCGGFLLDRMFSPEIFYNSPGDEAAAKSTVKAASQLGGNVLFSNNGAMKGKSYHFTASNITPQELATAIIDAMQAMGCDFEASKDRMVQSGVVKATLLTAKGMVGIALQVFTLTPTLNLVEIRKGKGDILEWKNAYIDLVERRIAHLLNKPKHPDEEGKEYY